VWCGGWDGGLCKCISPHFQSFEFTLLQMLCQLFTSALKCAAEEEWRYTQTLLSHATHVIVTCRSHDQETYLYL